MTTTALNAALSVGGTPGVVGAVKTTFQSATTGFVVSGQITMGNGMPSPNPKQLVRLWYASSPFSYTAAQGSVRLKPTARYIEIPFADVGALIVAINSQVETRMGDYIYTWIETEGFSNPVVVDTSLQEI